MASWVLRQAPWMPFIRAGLRLDVLPWSARPSVWSKTYFSTPLLSQETPAMLELKKHPYPSAPLDASVFEEVSEEYGYGDEVLPTTRAKDPCELLVKLVESRKLHDAEQVRSELLDMGVHIKPAAVYGSVALHALQSKHESPQARLEAFTRWWSLTPSVLDEEFIDYSPITRTLLRKDAAPNIPLITRFALISASKGFAHLIGVRALSLVVRYADPSVSSAFLDVFYRTAEDWNRSLPSDARRPSIGLTELAQSWYDFAVRQHCMTGRLAEAVELLRAAVSREVTVGNFTYQFVKERLLKARDFATAKSVDKLYGRPIGVSTREKTASLESSSLQTETTSPRTATEVNMLAEYAELGQEGHGILTPWMVYDTHTLALALRTLRHSMTDAAYPRPRAFARFLDAYSATGRTHALGVLRARSYAHSYQTASLWALAEMVLHLHRREAHLLLLAFGHHFHLVGVPRWLSQHLPALEALVQEDPFRFGRRLERSTPVRQKLWPSSHHTALVWRSVAQFSQYHPQALENLYAEFLAQLDGSLASRTSPSHSPLALDPLAQTEAASTTDARRTSGAYPEAIPPPVSFDAAHFNSFVFMFAKRPKLGAARAARVIVDMYTRDFAPDQDTLSSLGAAFVRGGQAQQLEGLLARMDEPVPVVSASDTDARRKDSHSVEGDGRKLPAPTVATYTAIVRAFVQAGQYEQAMKYVGEMRQKTGYREGMNPLTDRAVAHAELGYRSGWEPLSEADNIPAEKNRPQWWDADADQ